MVALSASRLVCPAIAWISPTTSPMRVAASPSFGHGADGALGLRHRAARRLRSTLRPGSAISPIEAASSSTELAAAVTLPEAALTRLSAVRASAETVSAALLSLVDGVFELLGGAAQLARAPARTDVSNARDGGGDHLAALLARAAGGGLALRPAARARSWCRGTRSRCAPWRRSRRVARVAGNACGGVAGGEPRHRAGQAVERPRDAAADQPAEAEADQHRGAADRDDDVARSAPATRSARADAASALSRADAMILSVMRHDLLQVEVERRDVGRTRVGARDPFGERIGVGLHLLARARPS